MIDATKYLKTKKNNTALKPHQWVELYMAGLEKDEIVDTQAFYTEVKALKDVIGDTSLKKHEKPLTNSQKRFFKRHDFDPSTYINLTYAQAQSVIREYLLDSNVNPHFVEMFPQYKQYWKNKNDSRDGSRSKAAVIKTATKATEPAKYESLDDVPLDDVDTMIEHYKAVYKDQNGTAAAEDLAAAKTAIKSYVYEAEPELAAVKNAITYYVRFHDSKGYGTSLFALFDPKKRWLLNNCIAEAAKNDVQVLELAKERNMTVKQVQSAIRRGDIFVEHLGLQNVQDAQDEASGMLADIEELHEDEGTMEKFLVFKSRPEIRNVNSTPAPTLEYLKNAIAIMVEEYEFEQSVA